MEGRDRYGQLASLNLNDLIRGWGQINVFLNIIWPVSTFKV